MTATTRSLPPSPVRGLSPEEERMTAGSYFDEFAWEPVELDIDSMSAEEFFDEIW